MRQYIEYSGYKKEKLMWMWLAVFCLVLWVAFQIKAALAGQLNLTAAAYFLLFSGLMIWRYGISYTYVLTEEELLIYSKILGISWRCVIPFAAIETYSNQYVKRFFRHSGMKKYQYQYCSADGQPIRIIVFYKNGKKNAVLLKTSDIFIKKLQILLPDKYLAAERS